MSTLIHYKFNEGVTNADQVFAAAPQLYDGNAESPVALSAEQMAAIEGINTANVLFGTRGLAVYTAVTEQTIIDKAKKYLKVPA